MCLQAKNIYLVGPRNQVLYLPSQTLIQYLYLYFALCFAWPRDQTAQHRQRTGLGFIIHGSYYSFENFPGAQ